MLNEKELDAILDKMDTDFHNSNETYHRFLIFLMNNNILTKISILGLGSHTIDKLKLTQSTFEENISGSWTFNDIPQLKGKHFIFDKQFVGRFDKDGVINTEVREILDNLDKMINDENVVIKYREFL